MPRGIAGEGKRSGRPPKEVKTTKQVQFRVSEELWEKIRSKADIAGQSITTFVTRMLEKAISDTEKENKT